MMSKPLLILLSSLILLLISGCVPGDSIPIERPTPTPNPELMEAEVYRLVISELYPEGKMFFVFDEAESFGSKWIDELENVKLETRADFESKNQRQHPINSSFKQDSKFIFTSLSELWRQFKIDDPQIIWELDFVAIRETYPDVAGILELSRVGFDSTFEQTLVDISFVDINGGSRSDFTVILLSRTDDSWQIIDSYHTYEEG